jgi:hypothetical protein
VLAAAMESTCWVVFVINPFALVRDSDFTLEIDKPDQNKIDANNMIMYVTGFIVMAFLVRG